MYKLYCLNYKLFAINRKIKMKHNKSLQFSSVQTFKLFLLQNTIFKIIVDAKSVHTCWLVVQFTTIARTPVTTLRLVKTINTIAKCGYCIIFNRVVDSRKLNGEKKRWFKCNWVATPITSSSKSLKLL